MWILLSRRHLLLLLSLVVLVVLVVVVAVIVVVVIVQAAAVVVVKSWPELVNNKLEARASKYKFGTRAGKHKFEARAVKYKLGARAVKYILVARARAGGQAKGWEPGNANTLLSRNFEFPKKNCSIANKRLFPPKFSQSQVSSRKGELCKKWNLKSIRSN